MNSLMIYLISVLDNIQCVMSMILLLASLLILITILIALLGDQVELIYNACKGYFKPCAIIMSILLGIAILIPSSTTVMMMIVAPHVSNNQSVEQLPTSVVEFVNVWLKTHNKHCNVD